MSGRARPCAVLLGLSLLVIAPGSRARAAEDRAGVATRSGWWNRVQGPADGEPDGNPARPVVPPVPASPTVPADAIAVSAGGGQADKVAAVGIDPAVGDGATVDAVSLRMVESSARGANVGAETAKIVACPATAPWRPGRNAPWNERPAAGCNLASVQGVRSSDGAWVFDVTPIARFWSDPAAPLANNGVVLSVDAAASPGPVQVSWNDVGTGTVAVYVTASPAPAAPAGGGGAPGAPAVASAGGGPESAAAVRVAPDGAADAAAPGSGAPAVTGTIDASPILFPAAGLGRGGGETATPAAAAATTGAAALTTAAAAPPAPRSPGPPTGQAVGFWADLPLPAALLVPLAAGLAVLVGLVLGPLGRPSPVLRREGGLSRALARRAADEARPA